jgi:nucleotide-binding universal stress UspA family protein
MANPFRSEAEAYRFLLITIGYFAAIVIATLVGGRWVGFAVFVALSLVGLWWLFRRRPEAPVRTAPPRRGTESERRILVIANETVAGETLRDEIRRRSAGYEEQVLVVCPALNSPLRHWASDEDRARVQAQERLNASLARLRRLGIDAKGEVGDGEPLQAMEDALRLFGADEIIISTHPEGRSHWLEKGVVEGARERFAVPITHVVVDLEAEREEVRRPEERGAPS